MPSVVMRSGTVIQLAEGLKTWLRNSMTQERLCSVALCHVHQDVLDTVSLADVAAEFAGRSDIRKSMFGNGPFS